MLSRILDPVERAEAKRSVVQSELHVQLTPKRNPLDKEKSGRRNVKEADTADE